MKLKPSRQAQIKIDALVRAASKPDGKDLKFFQSELEKYIAKLEGQITHHEINDHFSALKAAKAKRMQRVASEAQDVEIAILMRNSK
jgi:hypothetical protein